MIRFQRRALLLLASLSAAALLAVAGAGLGSVGQDRAHPGRLSGRRRTDAIARLLGEKLRDELGVPVIVENKPGRAASSPRRRSKAAPADGSTFFISHDHTISILPLVARTGLRPGARLRSGGWLRELRQRLRALAGHTR